ncbi:hypothetical protein pdam_00008580 [Pocillopora damicornis]|uniref:Essential MCU regulator, mitochondrial n=1 Tax=Pocillopora damicornis TaxID=46731 RepID=A0A3M6U7Z5_POCDA|nr:hypothetical protein pdam_00008580 [Pocillopora damicornis]
MKFKSSVCLVVLAIVILYCVHGGVAGQHREDCVKKEEPEPHKIFVTITITESAHHWSVALLLLHVAVHKIHLPNDHRLRFTSATMLRLWIRSARILHHHHVTSLMRSTSTCSTSGAVLSKPESKRFGLVKVTCVVIPFLYVGGIISREGAAWLEENDIFSPEDDD